MEHRKKRKTRKCKLKLGKTLAEIAAKNVPRITCITRIRQAKAWENSRRKRGKRRFYYPLSITNNL